MMGTASLDRRERMVAAVQPRASYAADAMQHEVHLELTICRHGLAPGREFAAWCGTSFKTLRDTTGSFTKPDRTAIN